MGYIYKITNDIDNKIYIGQTTKSLKKRWRQHKCCSTKPYFSQVVLYKAINEYGIEHFQMEKIEEVDNSKLDERERYWIKSYNSFHEGYNSTLGGKNITLYEFNEKEIIQEYYQLKSARKVAEKYKVDHSTVNKILNKNHVKWYGRREVNAVRIAAQKDELTLHFNSIIECAEYFISNNLIKSKSIITVKGYICDVANNRKDSYYGWIFYKE